MANSKKRIGHAVLDKISSTFAIVKWLSNYSLDDVASDFVAGLTIGLIIIPQSIAYVALVGLSQNVGLTSTMFGAFFYALFGTIKEISVAPTAMMSLLTNEYSSQPDEIGLLTFTCGCVGLILSLFNLSILVEFISKPVTSAFGTSVALIIIASEMKGLLGLQYKSSNFFESLYKLSMNYEQAKFPDSFLGITTICFLLLLDKLKSYGKRGDKIGKCLWMTAMSKNAIAIILTCAMTDYFIRHDGSSPYILSDPARRGFPPITNPVREVFSQSRNTTISVPDQLRQIGSGALMIPMVALLVHVSIAKALGSGSTVRISNELCSLSIGNLVCSLFNATPTAGAFTRGAVSFACDVRTPISNIYSAILAFLALTFLTPYFGLMPRTTLSAVIIVALIVVIDVKVPLVLWKSSKKEMFVYAVSLLCCLYFGIQYGLIIGTLTNLLFLLHRWARPVIHVQHFKNDYGAELLTITPDLGLFYPAVEFLNNKIRKSLRNRLSTVKIPIAINCRFFKGLDYTTIIGLKKMVDDLENNGHKVIFFNVPDKAYNTCKIIDTQLLEYFTQTTDESYLLKLFGENVPLNDMSNKMEKIEFSEDPQILPLLDTYGNRGKANNSS